MSGHSPTFPRTSIGLLLSLHTVIVTAICIVTVAGFIALAFMPAPPSDTERYERESRRDRGDPLPA